MATIRRAGFGTVFELEDSKVGIGTDAATHTLQALGNIRSEDATDIGISSLSTYRGFVDKEARFTIGQIDNQSQSGSTSGEIVIDGDVTVSSATTFTSGPQHLTVTDTFTLPSGDTNSRELKPTPGSLRFNQDFATLEFYTGNNWATVNTFTEMQNSPSNRGRGIFGGFGPSPTSQEICSINIHSASNAVNFGDLNTTHVSRIKALSSSTRGVFGTGAPSASPVPKLDYITIASEGNGIEFGNLTSAGSDVFSGCMLSSSTRGIIQEATNPTTNVISFIEIATIGNAVDFGDMKQGVRHAASFASPTKGVICGGYRNPQNANYTEFQSLTIASKGNSIDFGSLSVVTRGQAGLSNSVRGIQGGGISNAVVSSIEFLTIASGGDATVFGDLQLARRLEGGGCASQTRGVFGGGYSPNTNIIEFINISDGGKAQDFGDLTNSGSTGGLSDCHGGLGGF